MRPPRTDFNRSYNTGDKTRHDIHQKLNFTAIGVDINVIIKFDA